MREQFQSNCNKYGAPDDHERGVDLTKQYLEARDYVIVLNWPQYFSQKFIAENKNCPEGWLYDLAAWKYNFDLGAPNFVVEINGKKHDSKLSRIKDGIAQKWINEEFPMCKFVRIRKEDTEYPTWLFKKLGV